MENGNDIEGSGSSLSYISPIGYGNSASCGYCGRRGQSYSYYASSSSLTPSFYQTLLDRCWRRSGTLLYRPDQKRACCPHYTLRLDSLSFKPSRDQRQTINRFNKYVLGEDYIKQIAQKYPRSRQETKRRDNEFDFVERIHEAETTATKSPPEPAHNLTVTLEDAQYSEEKYLVFENYQRIVHKEKPEDISVRGFRRFLCDSPLKRGMIKREDGTEWPLGSFHQCYRLDGKLVAIGVLDLLPSCVSAVYFLYHESIHKFSPGKLGALREISLAVEGGYKWWYPGFYIHHCPKMRYKMDYGPQYMLDPESLNWDLFDDELSSLLDKQPYVSMSRERQKQKQKLLQQQDLPIKDVEQEEQREQEQDGDPENDSPDSGEDDATDSIWLFNTDMPGITPLEELLKMDLDEIAIRLPWSNKIYKTGDLFCWETDTFSDWPKFKAVVAELIAVIGPDLVDQICLAPKAPSE